MRTTTCAQAIRSEFGSTPLPESAWALIERHRSELLNQAVAILGSLEEAEDVVQETFCDAFRDQVRLGRMKSVGLWLRQLNRANAISRLRTTRRRSAADERLQRASPGRAVSGGFRLLELRETLATAIEALPEPQRSIVALRTWEGLSSEEIGTRMELPAGTVRREFHEATFRLFRQLKPHLPHWGPGDPAP